MRNVLALLMFFNFALAPFGQDDAVEEGVKQVEKILNRIDNCAFLYIVKKDTDKSGAAFKRLALHARGPVECGTQMDGTLRVSETIQWLEPSKNPIELKDKTGIGGGVGDKRNSQLTHNLAFYDGAKTYAWNDQTNGVQIEPKFNFYVMLAPPNVFSLIETRFFSPLICTFKAYREFGMLNSDIIKVDATSTRIQLTITDGQEPNLLKTTYFIDREKGIERSAIQAKSMDYQDITDEFQEINGVWVPKKGRFIDRRTDETTYFEVLKAKVNDASVVEALVNFDYTNPEWNEKKPNASLPLRKHPSYVQAFFGVSIKDAMSLFLQN